MSSGSGWALESSHFFVDGRLADEISRVAPAGYSFVAELWDEEGDRPAVVRDRGEGFVLRYCDRLRDEPLLRQALARRLRQAFWWVRNARWSKEGVGGAERVVVAELAVLEGLQLLELGGVDPAVIWSFVRCQMAKCVCEGCDLWDGQRLACAPSSC